MLFPESQHRPDSALCALRVREAHIRRLHVLEVRAARSGIGTPPEVQIEIDDIRSEIARITRLLQSAED
jgi:hypothetical protein